MRLALLVAFLLATAMPFASEAAPRRDGRAYVDRGLVEQAKERPDSTLHVLVVQRSPGAGLGGVKKHGGRVKGRLRTGNALAVDIPAKKLDALAKEPGVLRIALDPPMRLQALPETGVSDAKLKTVYPLAVKANRLWSSEPTTRGSGVTIAVLDSGIAPHRDFTDPDGRNRILARVAYEPGASGPGDDNGHGTHVAGVIAGRGLAGAPTTQGSYIGIAPGANLVSVKVSDRDGRALSSNVIQGIEWAIANRDRFGIRLINLSLLSTVAQSYRTSLLDAAVELAWLNGIVVVVSAGNLGPDSVRYPPANDPFAIVVGATDDAATASILDDRLAWFSSFGVSADGVNKPDFVAPGRRIYSALGAGRPLVASQYPERIVGDGQYIRLTGTSQAAPVVSGVAAMVLQGRPALKPGELKWLLRHTASRIGQPGTGAGYPDAAAALNYRGELANANRGLMPSTVLLRAACDGEPTRCPSLGGQDTSWDDTSWDDTSWDDTSWDDTSWDDTSWDDTSWDDTSWDTHVGD